MFHKQVSFIAYRFTKLLKKDAFYWDDNAQQAFNTLKTAIISAPVLFLPDFSIQFILQTDASDTGMGAVLTEHGHPISLFSKKF